MELTELLRSLGDTLTSQSQGAPDVTWRAQERSPPQQEDAMGLALTLSAPRSTQPGSTWPADLVVLDTIGRGGMASVLLARQAALNRTVAVKVPLGSPDGPHTRALLDEARVAGALEHPSIISFHALAYDEQGW